MPALCWWCRKPPTRLSAGDVMFLCHAQKDAPEHKGSTPTICPTCKGTGTVTTSEQG